MSTVKQREINSKKKIEQLQQENHQLKDRIEKAIEYCHGRLGFLENCFGGNEIEIRACITIHNEYLKILKGE